MHMKWDYYNNTNIFKPAYNVQFGVSSGYIRVVHISQNCNDIRDFIPTVEKYHEQYKEYPKMVPADAGYGSYDTYRFCEDHGIELMMKHSGQNKEGEEITDKNRFRSWAFERTDQGVPICPGGHEMELLRVRISNKGIYPQEVNYYGCSHCQECPLKSKCTRSKYGRKVQICPDWERMKRIAKENMSTEEGHEIMVSRSIQAEGTFGDIKENYGYSRLKRRGLGNVKFEIYLVALGHNIRKMVNRMSMDLIKLEKYGKKGRDNI